MKDKTKIILGLLAIPLGIAYYLFFHRNLFDQIIFYSILGLASILLIAGNDKNKTKKIKTRIYKAF